MTPYGEYRLDLRQYLLGNVSADVQRQVELLALTEKTVLEEVLLLEEELIDDYVSGDLPDPDRRKFEQYFLLTPERRQKLRAAVSLTQLAARKSKPLPFLQRIGTFWSINSQQLKLASSAALIVVLAGGGYLAIRQRTNQTPQTFASVNLAISASNRGAGAEATKKVQWPLNADALKISLALPVGLAPAGRYRVELDSGIGKVKPLETAVHDGQSVLVTVPAGQLSPGQYALRIYAIQSDGTEQRINGSYLFNIE
jgi:hypothetical protein